MPLSVSTTVRGNPTVYFLKLLDPFDIYVVFMKNWYYIHCILEKARVIETNL